MAANVIERTLRDGIQVLGTPAWGTSAGNLLRANVVRKAGDDGIDVESPAAATPPTTLTGNLALHNAHLGIKAGPGVTDGGGNRARGNGDPAQCTSNIVCA